MKITSLYIDDYKLLKNFTIDFKKDISVLIGVNGSGKSSILESIAQIFSNVFLNQKSKFGFRLTYELQLEEILEQTATTSEFRTDYIKVEISALKKNTDLSFKVFVEDKILEDKDSIEKRFNSFQKILPSNIIIYYSGLSEIMKKICEPHDQVLSKQYRDGNINTQRPFFYFEPALFEIILISLLSYEFGDIPDYLTERAKIDQIESITFRLKKPTWAKGKAINWWGADGKVKDFLDFLSSIGSPLIMDEKMPPTGRPGNVIIEAWQDEILIITIIGQEKLFEIREHFVEEKALFKILNTLYIDGLWIDAKFNFINKDEKKKFSVLSEGEQQSIIIKGLIELVTDENTLFLFDEPDTYLHPSWQRNFIEEIIKFTEINQTVSSQFLITTHSPQLLSNAIPEKSDVQILEDGEIIKITPKYYGRDISTILYELMGVERRNKKVTKQLSKLFNFIEDEELNKAKEEFLVMSELLGEDDPAIVRAKTQIDYLEEAINETDN
ncbi:AAA family ATPase [Chryseobacterium sp.]|uniref:AAA family ATPase n=1 Tax=Chryseobacterium sp. TaxID=1871047 RepID=UPI002FC9D219